MIIPSNGAKWVVSFPSFPCSGITINAWALISSTCYQQLETFLGAQNVPYLACENLLSLVYACFLTLQYAKFLPHLVFFLSSCGGLICVCVCVCVRYTCTCVYTHMYVCIYTPMYRIYVSRIFFPSIMLFIPLQSFKSQNLKTAGAFVLIQRTQCLTPFCAPDGAGFWISDRTGSLS